MFYKITSSLNPSIAPSYLFGTYHSDDEKVVSFSKEVKDTFVQAQFYFFEADLSEANSLKNIIHLGWDDINWMRAQGNLNKYPETEYYLKTVFEDLRIYTKKEMSIAEIQLLTPLSMFFLICKYTQNLTQASKILDTVLLNSIDVNNPHKKILFLESFYSQMKLLMGFKFTYIEQIELYNILRKGFKNHDPEGMLNSYLERSGERFNSELQTLKEVQNSETMQRFLQELIKNRDEKMSKQLPPYLDRGNAFIAVGAAHLPGIIKNLEAQHYSINTVQLSAQIYPLLGPCVDKEKLLNAFRKIYNALYEGQNSYFKRKGISNAATIHEICIHGIKKPQSRTAYALELAYKHIDDVSNNNLQLFKDIHCYSYKNSTQTFFHRTINDLENLSSEHVLNFDEKSRSGKIRDFLSINKS